MSKSRKLEENKVVEIKSPAINKNEPVLPSKSITTNVKMDGNKATNSSQRSTDEILAAGNPLQLASIGTDDKEGRNISTEDICVAEQSSDIKESYLTEEQKKLLKVSNSAKRTLEMSKSALTDLAYQVFIGYKKVIDADEKFNAAIPDANKQSSDIKESNMTEKEIEEVLEAIEETTWINSDESNPNSATGDSTQYQGRLNSLFENRQDCYEFLRSQYPELVENAKRYIKLKSARECYQKLSNILKTSNDMSKSEIEEIFRVLEEIKKITNEDEQFTSTIPDDYAITAHLEKDDGKKVRTIDCEDSVDDIQKSTYFTLKLTVETKVEKDGNESTGNIQETENCPRNVESVYDDEPQIKIKNDIVESMGKAEDSSDLKHTNTIVNVSPILTFERSKSVEGMERCSRKDLYLKSFKKNQGLLYSEKEITGNAEAIETSKEQANQINDIIIKMKNVAIYEKVSKDYDGSTEYIHVAGKSLQNATEDKREENKFIEDIDRSNDDIKDLNADKEMLRLSQEMKHCKVKDSKNETINPLKVKIVPKDDFKPNFKAFLARQKSKLNEEAKKYRDAELMTHKQDVFSLEKGPIKAVAGTESHEEATVTTNQDEVNAEVPKTDKLDHEPSEIDTDELDHEPSEIDTDELDHEPSEIDIELEKNDDIYFEFQTNGNKHIGAGGYYYLHSSREKQGIRFNYNDESIQVSFTGNNIFVSTPYSEFNISVRKSDPVNFTNEETQTETSPSVE